MIKKLLFVMLLLGPVGFSGLRAQYIAIEKTDGSQLTETISSVENIMFPPNNLEINLYGAPSETVSLFSIRRITFDLATGNSEISATDKNKISVYPNPANNYFVVSSLPEQSTVLEIYSVFGELMKQASVSGLKPQVNVEDLNPGLYLIRVNGETLKLIRR